LGDATEIIVDRWLPAGLHHIESDRSREQLGLLEPLRSPVGRDTARAVPVYRLIERVDRERRAMGEQRPLRVAVQGGEYVPKVLLFQWEPLFPCLMPRLDRLCRNALLQSWGLGRKRGRMDGDLKTTAR
jgi:hypothetical protein